MQVPNLQRVAIILRGVSGSSKSTFADYLKGLFNASLGYDYSNEPDKCVICTADDYHIEAGQYKFQPENLGFAHNQCQQKFEEALKVGTELVICANVNARERDFKYYIDKAKEYGYTYFVMVMENRNNTKDVHNVPAQTLERQELVLRNSLKLR